MVLRGSLTVNHVQLSGRIQELKWFFLGSNKLY